jgi:hypothetical protein
MAFYPERLRAARGEDTHEPRKYGRMYNWRDHGICSEIPLGFRSRTILATARNPFQTYVSLFLFEWWKRPEYLPRYERAVPGFTRRFPTFPNLSFREYMELLHAECELPANRQLEDPNALGFLTERFVRYYFRLPRAWHRAPWDLAAVLRRIDDDYIEADRFREDMFPVRFIQTARLNDELREFLLGVGYDSEDIEFLRTLEHVLPVGGARLGFAQRSHSDDWPSYYTPELADLVRRRDRLIFTLFPELGRAEAAS